MLFTNIPRVRLLTNAPTPLEPLAKIGAAWGHPKLYIKRDDMMSLGLGGNKVRSSEFWLGEAIAEGADLILVAGAVASNQCRLVAAAACRLNLECHILHNSVQPENLLGNNLLNHLMGVTRVFLGDIDEFERADRLVAYAEEQRAKGRKPYIVGDPVVGALGYVNAALELHAQAEMLSYDISHLFIAGSMGPTEAGLLWGSALLGNAFKVYSPSVEYDAATLGNMICGISDKLSARFGFTPAVEPRQLLVTKDKFLGAGYDKTTPESLQVVRELAATEGIFIETTYNAKVFVTLKDMLQSGAIPKDEGVCVIHTGGIPALFGQGERF